MGHKFRLIGDNLNFKVKTHDMRQNRQDTTKNMFASAVILQEPSQLHLSTEPKISLENLGVEDILPSAADLMTIKAHYIKIICDIAVEHVPVLRFMKDALPLNADTDSHSMRKKTVVIPLCVLPYNEQYYEDDIKILEYYEQLVKDIFEKSYVNIENKKVHIGGDQLTRERLSETKRLRLGVNKSPGNFSTLGPITAEFFHMDMNFLEKVVFRRLYDAKSTSDLGTMKCEQLRISRTNVKADAHTAYEADQQFFVSYFKAYVVEMLLEFFGMVDVNSPASKHVPPVFETKEEIQVWITNTIGLAVDRFVLDVWRGKEIEELQPTGMKLLFGFLGP